MTEPTTKTTNPDRVFHHEGGSLQEMDSPAGWYWWDEAGLLGGGPYPDKETAERSLDNYVKWGL